jgi:hypothetical protein
MFKILRDVIDRIEIVLKSKTDLAGLEKLVIKRHLDMKKYDFSDTKEYGERYYAFRVKKFNKTNRLHNYDLTSRLHNTLIYFIENNVIFTYSDAFYYKYLIERFKDAFLLSDIEKSFVLDVLKQRILQKN